MNYTGYVTDSSGNPIDGEHLFGVALWNDGGGGGTLRWGPEAHVDVPVNHGLFNLVLGESAPLEPDVFDEALWLRITIDGVVLPRVPLRPSAYAFGLVPGAEVQGVPSNSGYALDVVNEDTDPGGGIGVNAEGVVDGLHAFGGRYGIYANTFEPGGNAILTNDYMKAYGYRSASDSWFYTPGIEGEFWTGETGVVRYNDLDGRSTLKSTSGSTEDAVFYMPIRVPSVLMGQDVNLERVVIHYRVSNANTYISDIQLRIQDNFGAASRLVYDSNPLTLNSTNSYSYGFTPQNINVTDEDERILNLNKGVILLRLEVHLVSGQSLYIFGVGARVGHAS